MKAVDHIKLDVKASIRQAMKAIDNGGFHMALVVDDTDYLLGVVTDGDVRRALLNNLGLDDVIETIVSRNPICITLGDTHDELVQKAIHKKIYQFPVVDADGKLIGIKDIEELVCPKIKPNKVVLMVGGLGTRLRPLTENIPKPMLNVGGKPILETIVNKFVENGFVNIVMCVNYKSNIIREYFKDGQEFGANIEYISEPERMGTAGALSLLAESPTEPFFVMNGDLLTNVNFERLLDFHDHNKAVATMCVREYDFQVPYGVVNLNGEEILSIEEKPVHKFFVSAGIYLLSPVALKLIPSGQFYDMPTLFEDIIRNKGRAVSFPIREYWLDIGRIEEYERANIEYSEVF